MADAAGGAIHVYSEDLAPFFSVGSELGPQGSPVAPIDVAVGPDGMLAVSDRGREAVLIYRILYR